MTERLHSLMMPTLIFLISVYGSLYMGYLPPLWFALLPLLPFVLACMAILLAWYFNKGRVLILVFLLLIPKMYGASSDASITAYLVISCFCIALLSFVKERGFINRFVLNRLLFVLMLLGWCYAVESKWISFEFLNHSIPYFHIAWSDLLLWGVLSFSMAAVGVVWWFNGSAFCASGMISILSLIVMSHFSISASQVNALLSAQFLLWIWFLLMESRRMAYLDELTGLPGRRALNETMLGLSKRYALAMVDVDHFKKFNDTYGHDMGDKVLESVASQLNRYVSSGRAFRFGGEEFTLVFRAKSLEFVEAILEDLRIQIESTQVEVFDPKKKQQVMVSVTASFGVAFASSGELPESVLKRADEALYQAKRKGRNRVSKAR